MTHTHVPTAINAQLMKIGLEVFPVYGDDTSGWSVDPVDLAPGQHNAYRYRSIDELFFALVNLNLSPEGQACEARTICDMTYRAHGSAELTANGAPALHVG